MAHADPVPPAVFRDKAEARVWARALLRRGSPGDRAARSAAAAERILGIEAFRDCELLLAFLSMPAEIDTSEVIRAALGAGKAVAAPRIAGEDIVFAYLDESWESLPRDSLGIPTPPAGEPIDLEDLRGRRVFALIPGLLFDRTGGRLGRGKGYYDRFLASVLAGLGDSSVDPGSGPAAAHPGFARGEAGYFVPCGFCFRAQVVPRVPAGERDVRVPLVATEEGVLRAGR